MVGIYNLYEMSMSGYCKMHDTRNALPGNVVSDMKFGHKFVFRHDMEWIKSHRIKNYNDYQLKRLSVHQAILDKN
jgi:hypothetical protein